MARLLDLLFLIASPFAAAIEQEFGGSVDVHTDPAETPAPEDVPLMCQTGVVAATIEPADHTQTPDIQPAPVRIEDVSLMCDKPAEAPAAKLVGHVSYHPEMGEAKPDAEIEASLSHYGKHWFLRTPLTLKGRGITLLDTEPDHGQRRAGWHRDKVTGRAFELLGTRYRIVSEALL